MRLFHLADLPTPQYPSPQGAIAFGDGGFR